MNAILPLNITALRVNSNDSSNITGNFKGRTGIFNKIPYGTGQKQASTGDTIVQPLASATSPANPLGNGVHVHWELPDYFRQGVQPPSGGNVVFPQAPNRWLVIRYLRIWDAGANAYGPVAPKAFIVESDYIGCDPWTDSYGVVRPTIPVPLPADSRCPKPFRFMGRVLNYEDWNPAGENPNQFLPSYQGVDGKALWLTSIGFVGPGFSNYYPECISVFGFWDHFKDNSTIFNAINNNTPIQFEVSYQVVGWINPGAVDPLGNIFADVKTQYDDYVARSKDGGVPVVDTPTDYFESVAEHEFHWSFDTRDITYTLNPDKTLATLNAPTGTLCAGLFQEVVWNMLTNTGTTYFLSNPGNPQNPAIWTDTVELAAGNTTAEALSALLKYDMGNVTDDPVVLKNYEFLLDALQLGMLQNLENQPSKMIYLDESLHSKAFFNDDGGWLWIVEQPPSDPTKAPDPDEEITLPLDAAEQLALLNMAQKAYDQGRMALNQMRKQLFMDWIRYVKIYVSQVQDPYFPQSAIEKFLLTSSAGEVNAVIDEGTETGILLYRLDPVSGQIIGIQPPAGSGSKANAVYAQFNAMLKMIEPHKGWTLRAVPAAAFYLPTDPVLLVEGDRIEPARRNGSGPLLPARLSQQLLSTLAFTDSGTKYSVASSSLTEVPSITPVTPNQADVQTLVGEAYLLAPMLAGVVGAAVPAVPNLAAALGSAQGGLSPLEGGPGAGLYAAIRATGYVAAANPTSTSIGPVEIAFTFTNATSYGWAPDQVGWNAQQALPEFTPTRVDPFLPVYLIWGVRIYPLQWGDGQSYTATNLTQFFGLNADAVDYAYDMNGSTPVKFTSENYADYLSSVVLSTKPTFSLTSQIENYIKNYPKDPADPTLEEIKKVYASPGRNYLSQAISGFSAEQTLRAYIPQIPVENLISGPRDTITKAISAAAGATPNDNWYDFAFNSVIPIATGPNAQFNFGPLRSGFMEVRYLEIVDAFGQRMQLTTATLNPDGSLKTIPAMTMQPLPGDTVNADMIYLPPRILAPTRLWFRWLSATFNKDVAGIDADFVEMNTHPATSPICGWVLPNHLDESLFFYQADGKAIGSFGLEHGDSVYRTRAANLKNPRSTLADDIGPEGSPTVNPSLATFMWYLHDRNGGFLKDLMDTIQHSDMFIDPAKFAEDPTLAVLIGRPLALARTVLKMETSGELLPLSQADTSATDPFPEDVNNNRFKYRDRQPYSSANLGGVEFPVRMGDLANVDDGMVGYLIEGSDSLKPYSIFYSSSAPDKSDPDVQKPTATTIQLNLNGAKPMTLTMLVDPRAAVHATTGVLPAFALDIPPDQYSQAMSNLAMTFFTHPVLNQLRGLVVPVPKETGYDWNWITPGAAVPIPLASNAANGDAVYNYTPQTLLEGWLDLVPAPKPKE
jgi:hypothetical protein